MTVIVESEFLNSAQSHRHECVFFQKICRVAQEFRLLGDQELVAQKFHAATHWPVSVWKAVAPITIVMRWFPI